ncbi:MAG: methyl-accepting chemotaxis protein [Bacillota bacterium]
MATGTISVKFKIMTAVLLCFILFIGILLWVTNRVIIKGAEDAAVLKAKGDLATGEMIIDMMYPGPWRREGDKLYKGDVLINDNYKPVDLIAELTGDTATIFCWDTRVATTVKKKEDNSRAVGTTVSPEVAQAVLKEGKHFYGEANVVGYMYQTAYKPIRDANGNIIGIWYVGAPKAFVDQMITNSFWKVALTGAVSLIVVFTVLWVLFNRALIRPLYLFNEVTQKMATGNLMHRLNIYTDDEFGELGKSFNIMLNNLKDLTRELREKAKAMTEAAHLLSGNASQTSANASEAASTMNQVAGTMTHVMESTQKISEASRKASLYAKSGREGIHKIKNQMNVINNSTSSASEVIGTLKKTSGQITQIVDLITHIADQTNLLALNAAIEAARAGEHGRGFAVVAEEVRKLAEQSANAAKEIQELIVNVQMESGKAVEKMNEGVAEVQNGLEVVVEVGDSFTNIINTVEGLAEQIQGVVSSIKQVSTAIQNVAATSQEQTAAMEEIAAATEALTSMADELDAMARKFKTE